MAGALIGSLGLAYALAVVGPSPWGSGGHTGTAVKPVQVGALSLQIPEHFNRVDQGKPGVGFDAQAVFADPIDPQRRLLVASISGYQPRAPLEALEQMLIVLLSDTVHLTLQPWQRITTFRADTMVGAWFAGIHHEADGAVQLHLIGVLTEDARRYSVVYLSHWVHDPAQVVEQMEQARHMMGFVCLNATTRDLRDAQPADYTATGLGWLAPRPPSTNARTDADPPPDPWLPEGLRARAVIGSQGQEPILLIPQDGQAHLHVLRLRGVIDTGGWDRSHPLSPASRLVTAFQQAMGRPPQGQELWVGQIANTQACRILFQTPSQPLTRQVWYARLSRGRGLLIEVLSQSRSLRLAQQWVTLLIQGVEDQLRQSPADAEASAGAPIEAAVAQGNAITHWQTQAIPRHLQPGEQYFLIEKAGQRTGCTIEQILPRVDGDPLPIRGRSWMIQIRGQAQVQYHQQWRTSADGARFWLQFQGVGFDPAGTRRAVSAHKMRYQHHHLSLDRLLPEPPTQRWAVNTPAAFVLPMLEDVWPVLAPRTWQGNRGGEALVWMSRGQHQPQPFWVQRVPPGTTATADQPTTQPTPQLLIRPMMSLDADRLTFDANGKVNGYHTKQLTGANQGSGWSARRIGYDQLLAIFPTLEAKLEQWRQDAPSQDTP